MLYVCPTISRSNVIVYWLINNLHLQNILLDASLNIINKLVIIDVDFLKWTFFYIFYIFLFWAIQEKHINILISILEVLFSAKDRSAENENQTLAFSRFLLHSAKYSLFSSSKRVILVEVMQFTKAVICKFCSCRSKSNFVL